MSGQGIAQILVYVVILIALGYPLGSTWPASTATRLRHARPASLAGCHGARLLPSRACRWRAGAGLEDLRQDGADLQRRLLGAALRHPASAGAPVPEPRPPARGAAAHRAEHDRELHHEHQLAVLRRRVHDVVPEPDGRARGAELRLCCRRNGGARRGGARDRAPLRSDDRQLLARPLPHRSSTSCCRWQSSSA